MERAPVNQFWGDARRAFTAGILANLLYIFVAAAFASNFFALLHSVLRIALILSATLFMITAVMVYPGRKGE